MRVARARPMTIAICHSFLSKNAFAFQQPHILKFPSTYKYSSTTRLHLKLTPEEIAASLGPDRTIASKCFTWDQLQDIVHNGDPTMHSRSMQVQEQYVLHAREITQSWRSMNDYILYSKFGMDKMEIDVNGERKFVSCPSLEECKAEQRVEKRLLFNEYPYFVCEGIEHWCLWKLGGQVTQKEVDAAIGDLEQRMEKDGHGALKDVLTWVNPPHLQSIPDIDHAHLLCLRDSQ
ncbi:hypothetical protein CTEN210_00482 [Chaetoceros tenuissimus]|uniref:Uncharacterized protein n=1 Tax=Chaetoceros tenuissimus TaxID=426638 RepID=A0AAD3CE88_9STRA|nr:hypothetical protein CTEN210_00482 [Chaetoceros tenuissimus]